MSDLYETYQALAERASARESSIMRTDLADPGRIDALRKLKNRLQHIAAAIETAVFELQNQGEVDPGLSRALSLANHCAAGAAQLLVAALDGSHEIRAAIDDMKASTAALSDIKTGTQDLLDDIGHVTGVLTTAGKVLELIKE